MAAPPIRKPSPFSQNYPALINQKYSHFAIDPPKDVVIATVIYPYPVIEIELKDPHFPLLDNDNDPNFIAILQAIPVSDMHADTLGFGRYKLPGRPELGKWKGLESVGHYIEDTWVKGDTVVIGKRLAGNEKNIIMFAFNNIFWKNSLRFLRQGVETWGDYTLRVHILHLQKNDKGYIPWHNILYEAEFGPIKAETIECSGEYTSPEATGKNRDYYLANGIKINPGHIEGEDASQLTVSEDQENLDGPDAVVTLDPESPPAPADT